MVCWERITRRDLTLDEWRKLARNLSDDDRDLVLELVRRVLGRVNRLRGLGPVEVPAGPPAAANRARAWLRSWDAWAAVGAVPGVEPSTVDEILEALARAVPPEL